MSEPNEEAEYGRFAKKAAPAQTRDDEALASLAKTIVAACLGSLEANPIYIEKVHTLLAAHLAAAPQPSPHGEDEDLTFARLLASGVRPFITLLRNNDGFCYGSNFAVEDAAQWIAKELRARLASSAKDDGREMRNWIDIKDRMPETNIQVLVSTTLEHVYTGQKLEDGDGDEWMDCDTYLAVDEEITHWMSMPKARAALERKEGK